MADETFAYLIVPKRPCEKRTGDYLQSKLELQTLRKHPQWDFPREDPKMVLVAAKRNLHGSELSLIKKRLDAEEQRKKLDLQWNDLENEAEKFKHNFIQFDQMVKENHDKRERARKKTEKQQAQQKEKETAIKELQEDLKKIMNIKEKMEIEIRKHKIYEDYLQSVVDEHQEFKTPMDVCKKFGALDEARNAVTRKLNEDLTALETIKSKILKQNIAHNAIIMGIHNRVAELHNRYDAAKNNSLKWERIVKNLQAKCRENLMDILEVKKAAWNIYLNMCEHNKVQPKFDKEDFENHLYYIKKTMTKLRKTIEIAQKMEAQELDSIRVEIPHSKSKFNTH